MRALAVPRGASAGWPGTLLPLLGVGLVVAVLVLAGGGRGTHAPPYSTLRADGVGLRAAFDYAQLMGLGPRRLERDLTVLDGLSLLFVVEPASGLFFGTFGGGEVRAITDWVARGGTLVLCGTTTTELHGAFEVGLASSRTTAGGPARMVGLHRYGEGMHLARDATGYLEAHRPGAVVLAVDEADRPVALVQRHGRGRVVTVADAGILANERLAQADNAVFLDRLLWAHGAPGEVGFDEYHHGARSHRNVMGLLGRHGLEAALAQILLAAAVLARATGGASGARPAPPPPDEAASGVGGYLEAMARIYAKAGATRRVVEVAHEELRRELASRLRLPPGFATSEVAVRLRQRGVANWNGYTALEGRFQRLVGQARPGEDSMLHFVREAARLRAQVRGARA
ncbi:MAG: hypothetical protein HY722_10575 [Planctomycetes bacterium]|nr:hypothetical protein [Planctomycetota bacterium]